MCRSYPIWNEVEACIYKAPKHFGAKDQSKTAVKIGTSASNSHHFTTHRTTRRELDNGGNSFWFWVDDVVVKKATVIDGVCTITYDRLQDTTPAKLYNESGQTFRTLAPAVGMSKDTLNKMINGKHKAVNTFLKLVESLGGVVDFRKS